MQNADRFTIITIIAVLIACVVALIAVIRITINIAGDSFTQLFEFGEEVVEEAPDAEDLGLINYAFEIDVSDPLNPDPFIQTGTLLEDGETINYAFPVMNSSSFLNNNFYADPIVQDALIAEREKFSEGVQIGSPETSFNVLAPKVGFESSIWSGFGADTLLLDGLWIHPNAANFPRSGGLVVLCSREAFSISDPRFCGHLESLEPSDLLLLYAGDELFSSYEIDGIKLFTNNLSAVYNATNEDSIKIITAPSRSYADQRLVISAKKVIN